MHAKIRWMTPALVVMMTVPSLATVYPSFRPETKSAGDVRFLTGGVGSEEREGLKALTGEEYNLKLEFAATDGAFISDVRVIIRDDSGTVVLDAVTNGPWFFAKLDPGRYEVEAQALGLSRRRSVNVTAREQARVAFTEWPPDRSASIR